MIGYQLSHDTSSRCTGAIAVLAPTSAHRSTRWLTESKSPTRFSHMVESKTPQLDSVFHALGCSPRRRMLRELASGERPAGRLAEPFPMSLAAAPKPIKALEKVGFIRREVRWRTHVGHLDPGPPAGAHQWLVQRSRFSADPPAWMSGPRLQISRGCYRQWSQPA